MATLFNSTTGKLLAERATITHSVFGHAIGLMCSPQRAMALCFARAAKRSIHTWFVFFPLTVLFLDAQQRIVEIVRLTPFSVYIPKNAARYIVELPGIVRSCRIGDRVRFKC